LLDKGSTRVKIQNRMRLAGAASKLSPQAANAPATHPDRQHIKPANRISNYKAKSQLDRHTDEDKK
jgi:hypothetical protein